MWSKPNCYFSLFIRCFVAHNIKIIRLLTICKYNTFSGVIKIKYKQILQGYLAAILALNKALTAILIDELSTKNVGQFFVFIKRENDR